MEWSTAGYFKQNFAVNYALGRQSLAASGFEKAMHIFGKLIEYANMERNVIADFRCQSESLLGSACKICNNCDIEIVRSNSDFLYVIRWLKWSRHDCYSLKGYDKPKNGILRVYFSQEYKLFTSVGHGLSKLVITALVVMVGVRARNYNHEDFSSIMVTNSQLSRPWFQGHTCKRFLGDCNLVNPTWDFIGHILPRLF